MGLPVWKSPVETIRGLIVQGNDKLAAGIWHFDVPPVRTCPGRSKLCSSACYARRGHFCYPQVQERLEWAFAQSKRPDFASRMTDEIYRKGVLVFRWHVAGDVYSPAYARKMFEVMKESPQCSFYFYTRSWRVKTIEPEIRAMTFLPNAKVWYSADEETGVPADLPEKVRVAWMQTELDDEPAEVDLIFRVLKLRKMPLPLAVTVCPTETPEGKERGTTCSTCQVCWR
jgi:hypothetical protein